MARQSKRVIIIGGGIIGGTTAYYLSQKGWSVTILEKTRFGDGASHGNCGLIVPTHTAPLNTPANLIKGIGWMVRKDAPLYMRYRVNAAWMRWLIQFIRHCFGDHRQRSEAGRALLMDDTITTYDAIIRKEGIDCDWEITGNCHLFLDQKGCDAFGADHKAKGPLKPNPTLLTGSRLRALMPALTPEVIGGWHDRRAAVLRPDAFMRELARVLKNMGVTIHEQTEWMDLDRKNGLALTAHTNRGAFAADAFVVATGAWTALYANALRFRIPIQPGKGYSVTVPRPAKAPALPCFFENERVVVTPWSNGLRLGGTMEFSGYDDCLNPTRLAALFKALGQYMPLPVSDKIEEAWCGWRPMTWDGLPIIDHLPGFKNVILAAGHNELGITMAPATGRLVAEMIHREALHVDPSFYRFGRFTA